MKDLRVTIAVVATSCEHLTATLDSLTAQSYGDISITVLHDLADMNIHGIIRNYPKIIYSIDIDDKNAIKKVKSFGRYFCIINSGDILTEDWAKSAVEAIIEKRISVLATLPVKLNNDGNIIKNPLEHVGKYDLLINAYLAHSTIDAILLIDTKKFVDHSVSSIELSNSPMAGIRDKIPMHSARQIQLYIENVIYEKPEIIISTVPEEKKADTVALIIKECLRRGNLYAALKLFTRTMRSTGYRKAIIKSITYKEKR